MRWMSQSLEHLSDPPPLELIHRGGGNQEAHKLTTFIFGVPRERNEHHVLTRLLPRYFSVEIQHSRNRKVRY